MILLGIGGCFFAFWLAVPVVVNFPASWPGALIILSIAVAAIALICRGFSKLSDTPATTHTRGSVLWNVVGSVAIFLIGLAALAPVPSMIAPYSLLMVLPALSAGHGFLMFGAAKGALVAAIAYFLFAQYISTTGRTMPKASIIVFMLIAILSIAFASIGWGPTARFSLARANALAGC